MLLKSLEIQGFKSFPEKTRLTFGSGITAVVGPNGSGKSNISDAIRWVLGEQSSKSLRGGKMEDVIFGGTVLRKPLGFAEVSLTIDNTSRSLSVENDEVKVTRRYYRSGESEYLLNGSEVRLRDVIEVFMDTGLGRDGYSIIGQGKIAEIVSAKSEDRREIFEEASGISKFRFKKEESERRLKSTDENLVRLHDILSELESRIGPLKEQSEKAAKYIKLAEEKKTSEIGLWLFTLDRQIDALRENDNRILLVKSQYDDIEQKISRLETEMEKIYFLSQKKAGEAEDLRKKSAGLEEQAAKEGTSAELLRNDIEHNSENINRIRSEIAEYNRSAEQSGQEIAQRRGQVSQECEKVNALKKNVSSYEAELHSLAAQGEQYSGKLEGMDKELSALTVKAAQVNADETGYSASLLHIRERLSIVETGLRTKKDAFEETRSQLDEENKNMEGCLEKLSELKNSLSGYELKLEGRASKLKTAEQNEREVSLKLSEKSQRASMLRDMEKHMEGFAGSVKTVMRGMEHGTLKGIHGPVSRLIKVEQKYAVAIETALGGALQNIVVENEENAKAAIEMLKRSDGGRATFLPVTSVKGRSLELDLSRFGGFIGIASALVEYEPVYSGIVQNLLGRTVVASGLDSAVAIARANGYKFRIVTLDGQVVNAGGSLTGGSLSRNSGLLSRASEIERLDGEAASFKTKLEKITAEKKVIYTEVSSLQASVAGLKGEAETMQEEKIRLEGEQKRLDGIMHTLEAEIAALETEKSEGKTKIGRLETQIKEASGEKAEFEKKTAALKKEMSVLGGGRETLAKKREELTERLTSLRMDVMSGEKDIENINLGIINLEKILSGHGEKIDSLEASIAELEGKNQNAEHQIEELKKKAQNLRDEAAKGKTGIESLTEEMRRTEQQTVQMRAQEKELSADKEKVSRENARLEERRASAQSEYDGLIGRLWDEYQLTRSEAEKVAGPVTEPAKAQKRLAEIKNLIRDLGTVNVGAIDEYKEVSERYEFMSGQINDVEKAGNELRALIVELTSKMKDIFSEQFKRIDRNFSETFVELFGGGSAKLILTEPDDVLNSGIEINVQPPGKIIKNLSALSGGEQAFVAIALYFAILKVRPSPFCVLDEIEAALDDVNVARFADYLRKLCGNTQFIVITHRRGTMEAADVLYGVTMQEEGVSKLLTLNVAELMKTIEK